MDSCAGSLNWSYIDLLRKVLSYVTMSWFGVCVVPWPARTVQSTNTLGMHNSSSNATRFTIYTYRVHVCLTKLIQYIFHANGTHYLKERICDTDSDTGQGKYSVDMITREQFVLFARNLMGRKLTGDSLPPHLHFVHQAQKLIT